MTRPETHIEATLSEEILVDPSCFLSSSTSQQAIKTINSDLSYTHEFPSHLDRRGIEINPKFVVPQGLKNYLYEAASVAELTELLGEYYEIVNKRRFPVDLEYENEEEQELREQIFEIYDDSPVLKYFGYRRGLPDFGRLSSFLMSENVEGFSCTEEDVRELDISTYRVSQIVPRYYDCEYNERDYMIQILKEEAVFLFTRSTLWSRLRKSIDAISDLGAPKFEIRPSLIDEANINIDIDIDIGPLYEEGTSDDGETDGDEVSDLNRAKALIIKVLGLKRIFATDWCWKLG
jgi:hypothetical protein